MSEQPLNVEQYNADLKGWGRLTRDELRASLASLGVRRTGLLIRMLKDRYRTSMGEVDAIGFTFPRYAVFSEKGAGRGYGGRKGSTWYTASGERRKTDPRSFGKMNTGARLARRAINPVLDRRLEVLADLVIKHKADAAINAIQIR